MEAPVEVWYEHKMLQFVNCDLNLYEEITRKLRISSFFFFWILSFKLSKCIELLSTFVSKVVVPLLDEISLTIVYWYKEF